MSKSNNVSNAAKKIKNVKRRAEAYVDRSATKIWLEEPSESNPYLTDSAYCHGYDLAELVRKKSFSDVIYLLFKGELPDEKASRLFSALMVACISPGPRSPAVRSATLAAVGKTDPELILPSALSVLSGEKDGAAEILPAMRYIIRNYKTPASEVAIEINSSSESERFPNGFGQKFGGADPLTGKLAEELSRFEASGDCLQWAMQMGTELQSGGLMSTGLFAAVLCDLGFKPKHGAGLYQLCNAPGIWAHGAEFIGAPITAVPFLDDDDYHIEGVS